MAENCAEINLSGKEKIDKVDKLTEIENQFLSGVPTKFFLTEVNSPALELDCKLHQELFPDEILDYVIANVDKVMNRTVYHKLNRKYPVKYSNQVSFLKTILSTAETRCVEICSDVYETYLNLLSTAACSNEFHFVHFCVDHKYISIKEKSSVISNGTTGLSVWQAGKVLAEFCADNRAKFANRGMIELGSGLGFTGISTVLSCRPRFYCLTDTHADVLDYMVENVRINLGEYFRTDEHLKGREEIVLSATYELCELSILKLSWEEELPEYVRDLKPDFILGADVIYDPSSFRPFCTCLNKLMKLNEICETILSCTIRNEDTMKQFFECLHEYKLYETLLTVCEVWNPGYHQKCQVQILSVAFGNL